MSHRRNVSVSQRTATTTSESQQSIKANSLDYQRQRHAGHSASRKRGLERGRSDSPASFQRNSTITRFARPFSKKRALFARSVGEETDIVSKEMYTFEDRDGSSLTLRPENTASVIRSYIEHRLDQQPGLQKLYYMGPMFRRERPQKGRYRQFYQIGAEAIGSDSPAVDAEVIEMVVTTAQGTEAHRI